MNTILQLAKDKTVLITGSTDGVGRFIAAELGRAGARVLVHGRNQERAERLVGEITAAGGAAVFYPADFTSLAEVRRLAQTVQREYESLDILINNAAVATGGRPRQSSQDGYELHFAVNYLAGFLLTRLLLRALHASHSARIVNVCSAGQTAINFDDVMLTQGYSGVRAYCQSKLAQVLFTFDIAEELEGSRVTANCLHPASYMDTTMVRQGGIKPLSTVEDGARPVLQLALAQELEGKTGLYFDRFQPGSPNAQAHDPAARARLREISFDLVGLKVPRDE